MKILVAGHSFIRRLHEDIPKYGLVLPSDFGNIEFFGIGGAVIQGRKSIFKLLAQQKDLTGVDLLILDIGSNDLDPIRNPGADLSSLATTLVREAKKIIDAHGITIVLCCPIPRAEKLFPNSFKITSSFNNILAELAEGHDHLNLWHHRRLFKSDKIFDHQGVHLNKQSTTTYFHSIKRAIVSFGNKLLQKS